MIDGSCLCGAVRFRLAVRPQFINHCHCRLCRKASGAGFGPFVHADGRKSAGLPPQSFWDAALPPSAAQTASDEGRP